MGKVYNNDNSACIYFTELTIKPTIHIPLMKEGERANLICNANRLCSGTPTVLWKWADGTIAGNMDDDYYKHVERYRPRGQVLKVYPTAHDHNKKITCVAEYGYSVVERTVTLTVKCKFAAVFVKFGVIWYISHHCLFFLSVPPKLLNSSQCKVKGKLLVCVCISWGNPPAPITWPGASLTDYSVSSTSSFQTVNSTITMPAADPHNTTVKCVSTNELGRAEIEIPLQNYTESCE